MVCLFQALFAYFVFSAKAFLQKDIFLPFLHNHLTFSPFC